MAKTNLKYTVLALLSSASAGVMSANADQSEPVEFTYDAEKQEFTIEGESYKVDDKVFDAFTSARESKHFAPSNVPNSVKLVLTLEDGTLQLDSFEPVDTAKHKDVSPAGTGERLSERSSSVNATVGIQA